MSKGYASWVSILATGVIVLLSLAVVADEGEGRAVLPAGIDIHLRAMARIKPGVKIVDGAPTGWSHLILYATPRLAEGDVASVPALAGRLASLLRLTVLADVSKHSAENSTTYTLRSVAIGLAIEAADGSVIVASDAQGAAGRKLDFVERTTLSQSEASLDSARQVARTPTMLVFDAEAIMWLDGEHRKAIQRHAVLVEPSDGQVATLVWLLEPVPRGGWQLRGDALQWLPDACREDRALHVDADEFLFGIPTQESFALVKLPTGKEKKMSGGLKRLAAAAYESSDQVVELEDALRAAVGWPSGERP
jgi:hypothetical protein